MKKVTEYVPTLDSREVAEMIGKEHKNLLRDIKRYISYLNEMKNGKLNINGAITQPNEVTGECFEPVNFFKESTYIDSKGEERPCYQITKKGCEFIAHKMTGRRGTYFTVCYINRFHDMEKFIKDKELQKIKAENEMYKNKIRYFDNAINSFAWKERINQKIKKLSEMTGSSENRILSQFYKIINNETYIKLDSFKLVYLLENNLKECSMFEVIANFESSRDCLETIIDRILELKRG